MMKSLLLTVAVFLLSAVIFAQSENVEKKVANHPHYLRALSDLRAARWMIEHRPGNWQQSIDETEAVKRIDAAINEIKNASIDDGKNINDHPKVDEHPDHVGRLRKAIDFLNAAKEDVNREEDNSFAKGLRNRALIHINEAIRLTEKAIHN